jgi:hypothetical protein
MVQNYKTKLKQPEHCLWVWTRDKQDHFIMIKGPTNQDDIAILNIYAPNDRASKYMKQNLIELKETETNCHCNQKFQSSSLDNI